MPKHLTEEEHQAMTLGIGTDKVKSKAKKKLYKLQSSLKNKIYEQEINKLIPEAENFVESTLKGKESTKGYAADYTRMFHQKMGELAIDAGLRN